ncbi:MAG: hypothetical protein A2297_05080 [Elusimicrobia bacterium RIFOXYB2_FULL_48_7]|nr:MAG: hypothetical protein A2297_05080 [Elusimicrobia bacterium RIFOXYB2_FULL_48_7]
MIKSRLFYLTALFLLFNPGRGASILVSDIKLSGLFDTNAALTRSSQVKIIPKSDYASSLSVGLSRNNPFSLYDSLSIDYRFDTTEFRELKKQNARKHLLDIKYQKSISQKSTLVPAFEIEYNDEDARDWSYSRYNPSLLFTYFSGRGIISEIFYEWDNKQFLDNKARNNYNSIGSNSHKLDTRFKLWHNSFLRSTLNYNYNYEIFEQNIAPTLQYARLLPGFTRDDTTHSIRFEEMIVFSESLLGNLIFERRANQSNSDPNTYSANQFGANIIFEPFPSNTLFIEYNYTGYDYYKNQFDRRYINTREDFQTGLFAAYQLEISRQVSIELKYSFTNNDSNDTIDFNPVFTKIYSSYSRTIFNLSLKVYL